MVGKWGGDESSVERGAELPSVDHISGFVKPDKGEVRE